MTRCFSQLALLEKVALIAINANNLTIITSGRKEASQESEGNQGTGGREPSMCLHFCTLQGHLIRVGLIYVTHMPKSSREGKFEATVCSPLLKQASSIQHVKL